jgi:hypothetical protein
VIQRFSLLISRSVFQTDLPVSSESAPVISIHVVPVPFFIAPIIVVPASFEIMSIFVFSIELSVISIIKTASVVFPIAPIPPVPVIPISMIPEALRMQFSIVNVPVSPYVIPMMPSDFIGESVMIDDYPSSMAIMV